MATAWKLPIRAKYPFLPESREYLATHGLTIDSFSDPAYFKIIERAKARIIDAIELGDRVGPWNISDDELVELASFPLAIVMIASIGDKRLARRFALAEASLAAKLLEGEADDVILEIAKKVFNIDVRIEKRIIGGVEYDYSIKLKDYLRGAIEFNKPEWKLVNRIVERGRVLVTARELIRLMRDRIMDYIISLVEKAGKPPRLPTPLEEAVKEIKQKIPASIEFEIESVKAGPETWPPCIRAILDKLMAGENVSHFANFALASFLVNIGFDPSEIIKFYANRPDFNERVARYQVEHIAGLRGSRTKYMTPSCSTMKTNGLCIKNGELCGNIRNPLTYYRRAVRKRLKLDKDKAELGEERGEAGGEAMREAGDKRDNSSLEQERDNPR